MSKIEVHDGRVASFLVSTTYGEGDAGLRGGDVANNDETSGEEDEGEAQRRLGGFSAFAADQKHKRGRRARPRPVVSDDTVAANRRSMEMRFESVTQAEAEGNDLLARLRAMK